MRESTPWRARGTRRRRGRTALRRAAALGACGALLGTPGAAQATRLWIQAYGTQTTTWSYPYFIGDSDCFHVPWEEEKGSETIYFRTPRVKALALKLGPFVHMTVGSWSISATAKYGIAGKGYIERSASRKAGSHPGPCGGEDTTSPAPAYDCSRKPLGFWAAPGWRSRNEMELVVSQTTGDALGGVYENCPVFYPLKDLATGTEVDILPGQFQTIGAAFPQSELMDKAIGKEIVLGKADYRDANPPGARPFTTETRVRWTFTVTKAR